MSSVRVFDPLADERWDDFVEHHPRASVFHSRGWLEALKRTYGYGAIALTTTERGPLRNGLPLCPVRNLTTRRLVSLPFSDHCDPLVDEADDLSAMIEFLASRVKEKRPWRSLELRPRCDLAASLGGRDFVLAESARYCLHTLNLARPAEEIFEAFHFSSTQRSVRRAERAGVKYQAGTSEQLLAGFFGLLRLTRRRHGVPPQPFAWFRNLVECLGDRLTIHVASKDGEPIAAILTLSFKKTMVYKYGGSNAEHHRLGGMPFLFWRAIEAAKEKGFEELDLGRSDVDQPGLIAFKDHLGATRSTLIYYTCPERRLGSLFFGSLSRRAARRVIAHMPNAALDVAGRLLYKHLG